MTGAGGAGELPGLFRSHERWLREALREAEAAAAQGEVPVGALVVRDGIVLGRGRNQVETLSDPTAHAEVLALGAAASAAGDWRLSGATLYVTLEPCTMCCGALLLARVPRLVYGASDPRAGAVVSTARLLEGHPYRYRVETVGGVLGAECGDLLRRFFAARREGPAGPCGPRREPGGGRVVEVRTAANPGGRADWRRSAGHAEARPRPVAFPRGGCYILSPVQGGEVRERLNRHDWKSCVPSGTEGSNPSLSASAHDPAAATSRPPGGGRRNASAR